MEYKQITLLLDDTKADDAAIEFVVSYARNIIQRGSVDLPRVTIVSSQVKKPELLAIGFVGGHSHQPGLEPLSYARSKSALAGLPADWRVIAYEGIDELISYSRLSDLVVVGRDAGATAGRSGIDFGILVLAVGTPVLVAPSATATRPFPGQVLILWDGSREAARAVRDALPLLQLAENVTILDAAAHHGSRVEKPPADYLARYLGQHHVLARCAPLDVGGESLTNLTLTAKVQEMGVGMVVMGAFHHSRARQVVFGGLTQDVLNGACYPVLMSH